MSFTLEDLYRIQKKDIGSAYHVLGKDFHNDPTWIHVIPDEYTRKKKYLQFLNLFYSSKYREMIY